MNYLFLFLARLIFFHFQFDSHSSLQLLFTNKAMHLFTLHALSTIAVTNFQFLFMQY